MERDLKQKPYTADEKRVVDYIVECGIGAGDDPIGFLISAHAHLIYDRNKALEALAPHGYHPVK